MLEIYRIRLPKAKLEFLLELLFERPPNRLKKPPGELLPLPPSSESPKVIGVALIITIPSKRVNLYIPTELGTFALIIFLT